MYYQYDLLNQLTVVVCVNRHLFMRDCIMIVCIVYMHLITSQGTHVGLPLVVLENGLHQTT